MLDRQTVLIQTAFPTFLPLVSTFCRQQPWKWEEKRLLLPLLTAYPTAIKLDVSLLLPSTAKVSFQFWSVSSLAATAPSSSFQEKEERRRRGNKVSFICSALFSARGSNRADITQHHVISIPGQTNSFFRHKILPGKGTFLYLYSHTHRKVVHQIIRIISQATPVTR